VPPDLMALLQGKDVMVGVIDVASTQVETAEEVADTVGRALQFVPRERLLPCTNCGLAPMPRAVAEGKLRALAAGAALARQRYGA
jgi:5-methyltetrahydropteroyltriglutamate--homocysteine methyltransferase